MRLIDADKVKAESHEYGSDHPCFMKLIDAQPTAYDADKVIEQLEQIRSDERIRFADQVVNRAIRVVKGGGVNETER